MLSHCALENGLIIASAILFLWAGDSNSPVLVKSNKLGHLFPQFSGEVECNAIISNICQSIKYADSSGGLIDLLPHLEMFYVLLPASNY